jgi:hypothetical protein
VPTKLFAALIAPLTPEVPVPKVTAPAPPQRVRRSYNVIAVAECRYCTAASQRISGVDVAGADDRAGVQIEESCAGSC